MPERPASWNWCRDLAKAPEIGRFFAAHAGTSYISHSELQFGRASAVGRWRPDLAQRIEAEALGAIADQGDGARNGTRCALTLDDGAIVGLAFVRFVIEAPTPFAVLEDLLIDPARRGAGLGHEGLDWLGRQCRAQGCHRLFLESGIGNHAAHRFFEERGFTQTSVVMMRDLSIS